MANACEVTKKTIQSLTARIAVSCSYRIFNSRDWDLSVCLNRTFLHTMIIRIVVSLARAPVLSTQCIVPLSLDPCTYVVIVLAK